MTLRARGQRLGARGQRLGPRLRRVSARDACQHLSAFCVSACVSILCHSICQHLSVTAAIGISMVCLTQPMSVSAIRICLPPPLSVCITSRRTHHTPRRLRQHHVQHRVQHPWEAGAALALASRDVSNCGTCQRPSPSGTIRLHAAPFGTNRHHSTQFGTTRHSTFGTIRHHSAPPANSILGHQGHTPQ